MRKNERHIKYNSWGGRASIDRHSWDIITECQQVGSMYDNNAQAGRIYSSKGLCPSIDTCQGGNRMPKVAENIRIRKLTPRECWRLMDFTDKDFEKAEKVNSASQLYKQAGNSIVVNCLYLIFKEMM